jgi:hypothetical protein
MKKSVFLLCLFGIFLSATISAQYTIPPVTGTECTRITQAQLKIYLDKVRNLVTIAKQDKDRYGDTGRYAAAALNFHGHAVHAHDSLKRIVNWMTTGGDGNPSVTSYAEAGHVMAQMPIIIHHLAQANWWAQISAVYHNSRFASCGREETLRLLAEAVNILAYSSRCYIGPYTGVPPPVCK